ncbi:MAG: hypothetical protein ACRETN_07595 [Nevskiales bacterium]
MKTKKMTQKQEKPKAAPRFRIFVTLSGPLAEWMNIQTLRHGDTPQDIIYDTLNRVRRGELVPALKKEGG